MMDKLEWPPHSAALCRLYRGGNHIRHFVCEKFAGSPPEEAALITRRCQILVTPIQVRWSYHAD